MSHYRGLIEDMNCGLDSEYLQYDSENNYQKKIEFLPLTQMF